jgi:EmrB/QacA subfamily drug resistance transporter
MQTTSGYEKRWWGLLFIGVSLLVISLDNTVLNMALPSISKQLGASASELQWIVDAYVLVFAALLLTMGSIGDKIGRKKSLQFGLIWFGVGSLAAALSTSTEMLIASRAFLGIGGATIMPATLSLITASFRDAKERAQAIAIWAAIFGLGVGIGPVIGGWLLERYDWSSVFYINLPIVTIAVIGGYFFLAESKDEHAPSPDIPGVILSVAGLFALVYAIIEAGTDGWTADHVVAAFVAAAVLLVVFGWWESRAKNAMLPLYLFRNMSFTGANLALTLVMFSMFGTIFFISQFFQAVQGYTALETGLRVLPMALTIMVAAGSSARIAQRLGTKLAVGLGFLIAAGGLFYLSQEMTVDAEYSTVLVGLMILAAGMGMAMSPATNSIMGSVPVSKAGVGSAMNDTTRMIGGALGVAVLGTVMNDVYLDEIAQMQGHIPDQLYDAVSNSIYAAHAAAAQIPIPEMARSILNITDQAFVSGTTDAMLIAAIVMAAASLVTFAILPAQIRPAQEKETSGSERERAALVPGD